MNYRAASWSLSGPRLSFRFEPLRPVLSLGPQALVLSSDKVIM